MKKKIRDIKKFDFPLCKFYEPYHIALRTKSQVAKLALTNTPFFNLNKIKRTAANYKIVYATSNQAFFRQSMFVIQKNFKNHEWMNDSYNDHQSYHGYINPSIDSMTGEKVDVWQRCISLPYLEFKIQRHTDLKVSYVNEKKNKVSQQLHSFKGYIFQHCMDHLNGKCVLDWDSCNGVMRVYNEAEDLFPKTKFVLKDYSLRIKQALSNRKSKQELIMTDGQKKMKIQFQQELRKRLSQQIEALTEKYCK